MRALVIGGGGFAGRHLIEKLLQNTGLDVFGTKLKGENTDEFFGIDFSELNIIEPDAVLSVIDRIKPDFVYHLAAQSSAALAWKLPKKTFDVNVGGTLNILEALKKTAFKGRLLFIGSAEEYGKIIPECLPISESCETQPTNIYALSKLTAERLCLLYKQVHSLDVICVRAFNHIGPFQGESFAASDFSKQLIEIEKRLKEPAVHVGNLEAVRDFTDVRDVVRAYMLLMEKGFSGEVYNVGGGTVCSVRKILELLIKLSGIKAEIIIDKSRLRPTDTPEYYADISKLVRHTGFSHEYALERTLKDVLDYWRKKVN
jgi:GDP-4-dehydro-6-deoxy-D-mannose reductase